MLYANLLLATIAVCTQAVICLTGHTINHACSCWRKLPVVPQRKLIGWTPVCKAWNTPGQPLAVWSIWGDSDEFGNKSVWCVQLCWSFWNHADSVCSDSTCEVWDGWLSAVWAIGFSDCGVLANQRGVWEGRNSVCVLFFYALCSVIPCFHVLEYWQETSATHC